MIHMRKRHVLICLLALAMMLWVGVAVADTGAVTAEDGLYLRAEASSKSEALVLLREGAKVEIESKKGDWYKVTYGKYEGYVYADYIEVIDNNSLEKGEKGDAVKAMQTRLKELGYYSSTCDGNFGAVTEKAVKAFQAKNGLSQTGVANKTTLDKMYSDSAIKADGTKISATVSTSTTLKKGDKGTAVKTLQTRLKELGYYTLTPDSSYGARTVEAVKAFQNRNGLTADGVAGPSTQKKLYSSSAVPAKDPVVEEDDTLSKGDKGEAVKKLQTRLKELGYYTLTPDSSYGARTVEAVKAFQKRNGLTDDGIAGPSTQKKLYSSSAVPAKDPVVEDEDETLRRGDKGEAVKKLQTRLKELGYYTLVPDSDYGARTVEAVKAFQKKNGLTDDGVAGPSTQKKLYSSSAIPAKENTPEPDTDPNDTLSKGDKGAEVKKLQTRLRELGYYKYVPDSEYGYRTVEAVEAFQKRNGLTADGVAGPVTQKKLYSSSAIAAGEEEEEDDETLRKGDKGTAVKELQKRLKELGYYSYTADGDYGARTVEAVKAFQAKNGLTADGVAGPYTQLKLNSDKAIPANGGNSGSNEDEEEETTLKSGAKGEAVKKLQTRLKELGYYTYGVDSSYGARTVEAVKAFQKNNNLTVDGIAGPTTQAKLYSSSAVSANQNSSVNLNTNQTLKKGDSGSQVKALQNRLKELGYYTTTIDSDYGYRTASAVSEFQRCNGLNVTGTADSTTLKKLVSSSAISKEDYEQAEQDQEETFVTERLDWFKNGESTFPHRAIIKIKDCKTGLIFNGKVLYGTNHLDVEPLTAADTAILLKINGGVEFTYHRRPMLVQYNGHVYAASIYSEPHGDQTILDNNFEGQFCLHFYGSRLHKKDENGVQVIDEDHQNCVAQAMKYTW